MPFSVVMSVLLSTVMFERLAQEKVTSFASHGSGAWCLFGFLMPMTPEDMQMMTALVYDFL